MKLLLLFQLFVLLAVQGTQTVREGESVTLQIGDHTRLSLFPGLNHTFTVQTDSTSNYSAFSIQLHTQQSLISLYNGSVDCMDRLECVTRGTSVGMVQIKAAGGDYVFVANVGCMGDCSGNVSVLVAVVGVEINHPIPGGCAKTSNLENDAQLTPEYAHNSMQLYFQDSDVGFDPSKTSAPPLCDDQTASIKKVDYQVYRRCLPSYDFSPDTFFDAIEEMLVPGYTSKLLTSLKYGDIKRLLFDSSPSAGEVYNVVAMDTNNHMVSAYIPVVTYGCNLTDDSCVTSIPVDHMIIAPVIGILGLFLCFLAHRFFHVEVYIFTSLVFAYLFSILLTAVTTWSNTVLLCGSIGLGAAMGVLLFSVWFFLGWYYIFVLLFGAAADFIVISSIMFTPLGTMFAVLEINYVYGLILVCGAVIFMVPLVAFPRALNIVSSSLVGSYAIIFSVGLFKRTLLTEIVLRVVKNASIPGFISSYSSCQLELIDIILSAVWGLLFFSGILAQALLSIQHKRAFKRKQANERNSWGDVRFNTPYRSFPLSPYKQIRMCCNREREDSRPLLSPHTSTLYGAIKD